MDDDWDLHAVVKGCATSSAGGGSTVSNICTDDFLPCENSEFDFSAFLDDDEKNESFEGLQEIYREFCVDPTPPPRVTAVTVGQVHNLGVVHMSQEENVQLKNPVISSNPIRPRRRKNQQTKVVREMTQEELSADSWAWRKYGQKPIKGSPYPRNYYRCSTSKGCAARKQVERSPNDPLIFIVSYTGEHAHPRPTHRSSLAGSTRNKLKNINTTTNTTNNKLILQNGPSSSFSPNTPLLEGEEDTMQNDVVEMEEDEEGTNISNIMMIPNIDDEDEDMFKMFQDSDHSSGAGGDHHLFSTGGLVSSPPWTPTSFDGLDGGGGG